MHRWSLLLFVSWENNTHRLPLQEAAMRHGTTTPRYLHIASQEKNKWGHKRSYRLQVYSFAGDHLPESDPVEKSMSWARWGSEYVAKLHNTPLSLDHFLFFCFCWTTISFIWGLVPPNWEVKLENADPEGYASIPTSPRPLNPFSLGTSEKHVFQA